MNNREIVGKSNYPIKNAAKNVLWGVLLSSRLRERQVLEANEKKITKAFKKHLILSPISQFKFQPHIAWQDSGKAVCSSCIN